MDAAARAGIGHDRRDGRWRIGREQGAGEERPAHTHLSAWYASTWPILPQDPVRKFVPQFVGRKVDLDK